MKSSIILTAISAGIVAAEMLPPPDDFPACGTTCFGNMLGQATQLGCGGGGSTGDAVDGACLCKNIDFSYGLIDCANAICPQGVADTVVQYGVNWCAEKGVIVNGLSSSPDTEIASSPTVTVSALATPSGGASSSDNASPTESVIISTGTNSDGSSFTTTLSGGLGETSGSGGVVIPISTTEIIATTTNDDGTVVTTLGTSTIFSTSGVLSGSGTETGSATDSGSATESTTLVTGTTHTADGTTEVTSATLTVPVTSTETEGPTTTESDGGAFQTAAPVGLLAAAGLVALVL
ncbi:putative CFEM-domain-containing protein [Rosellinia necatrix]|uniref:Putative CFEM-domain-containing protein n=1 Tax=Rosellinia necatrix TaxID=77044 RepID=A0A1W2TCF9_ROSNE|nr:putative CFEM-domain-containing protein [Rosellinia necatrix]